MEQREEGTLIPVGLPVLMDKTEILSGLDTYVPDTLLRRLDVLDFAYAESEYPKLRGKLFQVLFVEDDPTHLPFLSSRDGQHIRANRIYTRHGVSTDEANHEELQHILSRRVETCYSSRREMDLRTHLEQLKVLYEQVVSYSVKSVIGEMIAGASGFHRMFTKRVPKPTYPEEHYETFVAQAIVRKKRRIEMELDIEDIPPSDLG